MSDKPKNALAELAERLKNGIYNNPNDTRFDKPVVCASLDANDVLNAQRIVEELAKVIHGEASPTPWRKHTDREVRADDDRLWLENVVCQTQSCPRTRYTKAEREEWDIPATANTELIVASVNAVAKCREIAEKGAEDERSAK